MKYIFSTIIILYFTFSQVWGQINAESSFYLQQPMLVNPAASGLPIATEVFLTYRDQWTGFDGAPKMLRAAVQGRLQDKSGIGLQLKSYQWGVLDDIGANFSYAHQINLTGEHHLRLGASTGFFHRSVNEKRLDMENPDADITLNNNYSRDMFMQFGFGVLYRWKQLTVSVSSPEIYNGSSQKMFNSGIFWVVYQHKLPASDIMLTPSVLFKTDKYLPDQTHIALQGTWKDMVWLQAGYKTNKNLLFSTGLKYDKIGFGYSFESNNKTLSHFSYGSHEILLSYQFSSTGNKEQEINEP